jgi:hypothetical protein
MNAYDEEKLARLLGGLPPAPDGWVKAAQELPFVRIEVDEIVGRAAEDEAFRKALAADLERALAEAGYEPAESLLSALRDRLSL